MKHKFNINTLYFAGDIHGQPTPLSMVISEYDIRDSNIVILGDVGIGFAGDNFGPTSYLDRIGKHRNNTFYILRGNHDNPACYTGEGKERIESKYTNIKVLEDFDEIELDNGKKGIVIPGAISIDRMYAVRGGPRIDGKNYWHNENINYERANNLNEHYDFVLAHTGPESPTLKKSSLISQITEQYDPKLMTDINMERECIKGIIERCQPEYWINGHYHQSCVFDTNFCRVYNLDINEVKMNPYFQAFLK